jgi:hypothetical protein
MANKNESGGDFKILLSLSETAGKLTEEVVVLPEVYIVYIYMYIYRYFYICEFIMLPLYMHINLYICVLTHRRDCGPS